MLQFAKMYGLTSIQGKDITKMDASKAGRERAMFSDRPVSTSDSAYEMNATIAVRPNSANIVVAAFFVAGLSYSVTSLNKGETWSTPKALPPRYAGDYTLNPVVRYAPNSSWVYAVYLSGRSNYSAIDVMLSRSNNNGSSWQAPKVVFSSADYDYDGYMDWLAQPWVDVHYYPSSSVANPYVYVTCQVAEHDGGKRIFFRRSVNSGTSLDSVTWSFYAFAAPVYGGGARAIGGKFGDVLLVSFGTDNFLIVGSPFYVVTSYSFTNGSTWPYEFELASTNSYQLPTWLGPYAYYHRWWPSMFPSVAMTSSGVAYVHFTDNP